MAFVSEMIDQLRALLNDDASDTQVSYVTKKLYLNRGILRMWPDIYRIVEDATEVRFGDTPGRILNRTASAIAVVVPSRPVGAVPVVVRGPAGARTARDSFLVYQEPISDGSPDLRVYPCSEPTRSGAPSVTALAPSPVYTFDTLVINGTMLDAVAYVSFTYRAPTPGFWPG